MEMCVKCHKWCDLTDNHGHCDTCEVLREFAHTLAQARILEDIRAEMAPMEVQLLHEGEWATLVLK